MVCALKLTVQVVSVLAAAGFQASDAASTEVVIAHYNEDLSWVDALAAKYPSLALSVYTKAQEEPSVQAGLKGRLANVGRESHTYLHHIVENYHRLARWTVFTQGTAPSFGYLDGNSASGHLTDNVAFEDYLKPTSSGMGSYFVISAACQIPRGLQTTRVGILVPHFVNATKSVCPRGGEAGWTSWWLDERHPHHRSGHDMLKFYHEHVRLGRDDGKPLALGFAQGARFAVSQERILRRPLDYYQNLLKQVSSEKDPMQGYFLEAMWYDIFHPEQQQAGRELCELPAVPRSSPSVTDMWAALGARRIVERRLSGAFSPYNPTTAPAETTAAPMVEQVHMSMSMNVPDTTHFCPDSQYHARHVENMKMALVTVLSIFGADNVAVVFDCSPVAARRLQSGSVEAAVTITPPTSNGAQTFSALQISSFVNSLAPDSVSNTYVAQVQADQSLPSDVRAQYTQASVSVNNIQAVVAVQTTTTVPPSAATQGQVLSLAAGPSSRLAAAAALLALVWAP